MRQKLVKMVTRRVSASGEVPSTQRSATARNGRNSRAREHALNDEVAVGTIELDLAFAKHLLAHQRYLPAG